MQAETEIMTGFRVDTYRTRTIGSRRFHFSIDSRVFAIDVDDRSEGAEIDLMLRTAAEREEPITVEYNTTPQGMRRPLKIVTPEKTWEKGK